MQKISSVAELKDAIQLLEVEQKVKGDLLKEQLFITFESLKPANIIKSTLDDIASSPYLLDNILGTAAGLFTGFISKKIFIGASGNKIRKLIGHILQFGITNFVALHPGKIKTLGWSLIQLIIRKKRMHSVKP
ncbi:MAG TPA: hypothetical protein DCZ51_12805 [Bacteroidales bacterium]|nr:hypothetical protein [Bacteroidales bacterium]